MMRIELTFKNNGALLASTNFTWEIVEQEGTRSGVQRGVTTPTGTFLADNVNGQPIQNGSQLELTILGITRSERIFGLGDLYRKVFNLNAGVAPVARVAPVIPRITVSNPERLWLTYETRFNWPQFLKTNQKFTMNLFRVDAARLLPIFAEEADGLDDDTLASIRDVFFPTVTSLADLRELGKPPWRGPRSKAFSSPLKSVSTRDTNIVRATYAYMPYNARDNKLDDREVAKAEDRKEAIGTRNLSRKHKLVIVPYTGKLDTFNTASRSSVVKLKLDRPMTHKDVDKVPRPADYAWTQYGSPDQPRFLDPPVTPGGAFKITSDDFYKTFFSLKTGVNIIGLEAQDSKAILEHNSILAALRSAYIRELERTFGYKSFEDPEILILTEIVTVTEADPNWDKWMFPLRKDRSKMSRPDFGDGYQIRYLRGMKSNREYYPFMSIPFTKVVANRIDETSAYDVTQDSPLKYYSASDFTELDNPSWVEFWRKHFAELIGAAKAKLLLRYGLQGFGGNSQNFLLETQNGVPTGRVVFRDMGDYALHDYVLWALFGPGKTGVAPPSYKGRNTKQQEELVATWQTELASDLLKFECIDLHQFVDETTGLSEFPTFCGYHRPPASEMHTFNPFCDSCSTSDTKPNPNFVGHLSPLFSYLMLVTPNRYEWYQTRHDQQTWGKIFAIQTDWGVACVRAWVKYLEGALGTNFLVDWYPYQLAQISSMPSWAKTSDRACYADRMFDPNEYLSPLWFPLWKDMYEKMKTWEMFVGMEVENFLATADGQRAIAAYKDRKWVPVPPVFKLGVKAPDGSPLRRATILMKKGGHEWSEATDESGIIHFYKGTTGDYEVGEVTATGSVFLKVSDLSARADRTANFAKYSITVS